VLRYPPKPQRGDRVAVLSPAAGLPARFPEAYEQGLRRLRAELDLEPVEYPTTRAPAASAAQRAADLHAAFADPSIAAVMASAGGDDQITVLPYLDASVFRSHPKPFFGYSDNTNLLVYLCSLGLVSYHGGSVMVQLGRSGRTHPTTMDSLRAALFTHDWYRLPEPPEFSDEPGCDWNDPATLNDEPPTQPAPRWTWHRPDTVVEGPAWGGNLEILSWLMQVGRWIRETAAYAGGVLLLETSEELPGATEVYRILRNMGERGLLQRFPAVLVGRAKAWDRSRRLPLDERAVFRADQRAAVLRAVSEYHPDAMVVFDVDVGHTDPQLVVPIGGTVRVDGPARTIAVRY
jgi:muramoyltetrapeptide carboxypeptidase LdcA involved in peptidoglycan recycling